MYLDNIYVTNKNKNMSKIIERNLAEILVAIVFVLTYFITQ